MSRHPSSLDVLKVCASPAISRHLPPSPAISRHLPPSPTISRHLLPSSPLLPSPLFSHFSPPSSPCSSSSTPNATYPPRTLKPRASRGCRMPTQCSSSLEGRTRQAHLLPHRTVPHISPRISPYLPVSRPRRAVHARPGLPPLMPRVTPSYLVYHVAGTQIRTSSSGCAPSAASGAPIRLGTRGWVCRSWRRMIGLSPMYALELGVDLGVDLGTSTHAREHSNSARVLSPTPCACVSVLRRAPPRERRSSPTRWRLSTVPTPASATTHMSWGGSSTALEGTTTTTGTPARPSTMMRVRGPRFAFAHISPKTHLSSLATTAAAHAP